MDSFPFLWLHFHSLSLSHFLLAIVTQHQLSMSSTFTACAVAKKEEQVNMQCYQKQEEEDQKYQEEEEEEEQEQVQGIQAPAKVTLASKRSIPLCLQVSFTLCFLFPFILFMHQPIQEPIKSQGIARGQVLSSSLFIQNATVTLLACSSR